MSGQQDGLLSAEFGWPGGDKPRSIAFTHPPAKGMQAALETRLRRLWPAAASSPLRIRGLRPSRSLPGTYKLSCHRDSWLLRVSSRLGEPRLERHLLDFLDAARVPVNPILASGRLWHNGRLYRLDIRPLVRGRHFNDSDRDLRELACTLNSCHHALRRCPAAAAIRDKARRRLARFSRTMAEMRRALRHGRYSFFLEREDWARQHRSWLEVMTQSLRLDFHRRPRAQCLHAEIHPGNVIYRAEDGAAVLVDHEHSVHHYAPPAWDLAYFIQRFCLKRDERPARIRRDIALIRRAYGPLPQGVSTAMREIAWTCIAILVDNRRRKRILTSAAEWDKFVALERQARRLEEILPH